MFAQLDLKKSRCVLNDRLMLQKSVLKIPRMEYGRFTFRFPTICHGLFNMKLKALRGILIPLIMLINITHDRVLLLRVARRVVRKCLVVKNNQLCAINFWKLRQYTRYQGIFHKVKARLRTNQPRAKEKSLSFWRGF